jgi:hypothetical protein
VKFETLPWHAPQSAIEGHEDAVFACALSRPEQVRFH